MSDLVESSFRWVWEATLYGSALFLIVLAAGAVFGKRLTPSWQCALGLLAVVRFLLPFSPESSFSLYNWLPTSDQVSLSKVEPGSMATPGGGSVPLIEAEDRAPVSGFQFYPSSESISFSTPATVRNKSEATDQESAPHFQSTAVSIADQSSPFSWISTKIFAVFWFLGFLGCTTFAIWTTFAFRKRLSAKARNASPTFHRILDECRNTLGIQKSVGLLQVEKIASPVLIGTWNPTIVLPFHTDLTSARHVILHELAHLKRGDLLWNWLLVAARAIHWFNPVIWLATSKVIADRELACDAVVLIPLSRPERISYGRTLLNFAQPFTERIPLSGAVPFTKPKSEIRRRIHMIAKYKTSGRFRHLFAGMLAAAIALTTFTTANSADERDGERAKPETRDREGGEREGARRDGDREREREGARRDGDREHAEREGVRRDGDREHAEREGARRDGDREHPEREGARRDGDREHAEREGARRDGDREHAEREGARRDGDREHAEREGARRDGDREHIEREREHVEREREHAIREREHAIREHIERREGDRESLERRVDELSRAVRELHEMMDQMRRELAERR